MLPAAKKARVNLTEPVESVEPFGRPIPNYDYTWPEGYSGDRGIQ
jgi:hypothetical protein